MWILEPRAFQFRPRNGKRLQYITTMSCLWRQTPACSCVESHFGQYGKQASHKHTRSAGHEWGKGWIDTMSAMHVRKPPIYIELRDLWRVVAVDDR